MDDLDDLIFTDDDLPTQEAYEAFLAEKIRLGKEDIAAGRIVTLEELKIEMKALLKQKRLELETPKAELNT